MLNQSRLPFLIFFLGILSIVCLTIPMQGRAADNSSQLALMMAPILEAEALLANGTYVNGEFSKNVSKRDAEAFAREVSAKLRLAKTEYARLPGAVRKSKEADTQWYRMDTLLKTSKNFTAALQRHASAGAESPPSNKPAVTATKPAPGKPAMAQAIKPTAKVGTTSATTQQPAAVAAPVSANPPPRAEPTGPDWNNSFIPNIAQLKRLDGFFQWPWSQPSWKAVLDKAAAEQEKGRLGSTQVKQFTDLVLGSAATWPAVGRVDNAGDAQYVLDMVRLRESTAGLEIVDLWISRGNWNIQRNAIGAILSRTKPGYMLYKDPSGQACILKELWVKEAYAGGSDYEKATAWRYSKVRFQSCDRR
ncbi:MAG: hypothetical protein WBD34_23600 [Burkholderiaceae bacterium]